MTDRKDRVAYFFDSDIGGAYYGANHPMKPHRICMTHHLILAYGLQKKMEVYRPRRAFTTELSAFHDRAYIEFLATVNVENQRSKDNNFDSKFLQYGMGDDCPIFDGLYDFCQLYAGASIEGATKLNHNLCDIAINWSGGLHHAKKACASGFCYVNDLVLAILELLRFHARVLYVDIDVHHGDGVEEAFYFTDRVMCVSFHLFTPGFFPGSGDLHDIGEKRGKFYSLNVPLKFGATDSTFHSLFKPIMSKVIDVYRPNVIVLQCGADSLANDRLGYFNLTIEGHAEAVRYMKKFGIPMLVTGGGGYTKNNVARCWTYETAVLVGEDLDESIPQNDYQEYYQPDYKLNSTLVNSIPNLNKREDIEQIKETAMEYLRHLACAPAVQMHYAPRQEFLPEWDVEEGNEPVVRLTNYAREHRLLDDFGEFFDDEDPPLY